jgi:hypothetical protein
MSSDPLFSSIEDTMKIQRVTNLDADHAVRQQLDLAIDSARVEFYTRLGLTKLDALVATVPADPPTTEDHYRRLIAQVAEQNLLRVSLLRWLTVLAKEGNASRIHQEWNDIGAFRELSVREKEAEIERLQSDIDRAMGLLDGTLAVGTPRGRAIVINRGTDGVSEDTLEEGRVLGDSLFWNVTEIAW